MILQTILLLYTLVGNEDKWYSLNKVLSTIVGRCGWCVGAGSNISDHWFNVGIS